MKKTVDDWFKTPISPQSENKSIVVCRKEDGVNVRVDLKGNIFFYSLTFKKLLNGNKQTCKTQKFVFYFGPFIKQK